MSLGQIWDFLWGIGGVGSAVCLGAAAAAYFSPVFKKDLCWLAASAALITAAYAHGHHNGVEFGRAEILHKIAAQDKGAIDAAAKARDRVDNCNSTDGMRWDTETGQCVAG